MTLMRKHFLVLIIFLFFSVRFISECKLLHFIIDSRILEYLFYINQTLLIFQRPLCVVYQILMKYVYVSLNKTILIISGKLLDANKEFNSSFWLVSPKRKIIADINTANNLRILFK